VEEERVKHWLGSWVAKFARELEGVVKSFGSHQVRPLLAWIFFGQLVSVWPSRKISVDGEKMKASKIAGAGAPPGEATRERGGRRS